jgi:TonB family protein
MLQEGGSNGQKGKTMSDEPAPRQQGTRNSKDLRARPSNKTGILVAGAAAAAILLGGGYYAWKNSTPSPAASEVTDNTAIDNPVTDGAPLTASPAYSDPSGKGAPSKSSLTTASASDGAAATESAKPKAKARVAAAEIPTETIGVSRAGARANQNQTDELVVTGTRGPVWSHKPTAERLSEFYPSYALDRGREGEASLRCTVGERGILSCVSVSETPARAGFGRAAIQVARTFRHAEKRADGREAVGTPVNLRVLFRMADGERRG